MTASAICHLPPSLAVYTPKTSRIPNKDSHCHRFYASFTRLLTYRYKMCSRQFRCPGFPQFRTLSFHTRDFCNETDIRPCIKNLLLLLPGERIPKNVASFGLVLPPCCQLCCQLNR